MTRTTADRIIRTVTAASLAAALSLSGATAASASDVDDRKLEQIAVSGSAADIERLTPAELERLIELVQIARVEVVETAPAPAVTTPRGVAQAVAASTVCRISGRTVTSYGPSGIALYSTWINIEVCGSVPNGPMITSHRVVGYGGQSLNPLWNYDGPKQSWKGIVSGEARHSAQVQFSLWATPAKATPCVSLDSLGINSSGNIIIKVNPKTRCGLV